MWTNKRKNTLKERQNRVAIAIPEPQVYPHENPQKHLERGRKVPTDGGFNTFDVRFEV